MTLPGSGARLLRLTAWRHACRHRLQSALVFLGIALGVMMVVAVDLANNSARRAFDLSLAAVNGNITHQILGGSAGVPDEVFTALRTGPGLRRSAPTVSGSVRINGQQLTLLGLDLVSEASLQRRRPGFASAPGELLALGHAALGSGRAVLMGASQAEALGLVPEQEFRLESGAGTTLVRLAATFGGEESVTSDGLVFADIAIAQALLGRSGVVDSIDLNLDDAQAQLLADWLPPALTLVASAERNDALAQMSAAFRVNLLAMSLLALLVAALLIYNTVSLSVLQRRPTLGVLRSLGVGRGELVRLVLTEAAVLGVVASSVGALAGLALGQGLVQLVTRTIDDLYFNLTVTRYMPDPLVLLKGWLWGVAVTLVAAALPAWQAGRTQPVTLQQRSSQDAHGLRHLPLLAVCGVLLLAVGWLALVPARGSLVGGFVALNLIIGGFCLTVPLAMQLLLQGLLRASGGRLAQTLRLALANLQAGISRTGLAVAALAVAVSVTVGVGVMVGSFRQTVLVWLDQTLVGDLQLTRPDAGALPPELQELLEAQPEASSVTPGWLLRAESALGEVRISASAGPVTAKLYLQSLDADDRIRVEAGEGVLVSEPFAYLHLLAAGDTLQLHTPTGIRALPVLGIFHDYSTGPGMVVLAEGLFRQLWPAQDPNRFTLALHDPASATAVAARLRGALGVYPGNFVVAANADIRRLTLAIFDRTFAITDVLRLLAIVVAFVGVLSALLALQLERMRDYALLRATGMTVREVAAMISFQTLVMGLLAGLFALPLGLLMSDVLIDVINRRSFGWSMLHVVPPAVLLQALALALAAAVLAGIQPALRIAGISPAAALRQE